MKTYLHLSTRGNLAGWPLAFAKPHPRSLSHPHTYHQMLFIILSPCEMARWSGTTPVNTIKVELGVWGEEGLCGLVQECPLLCLDSPVVEAATAWGQIWKSDMAPNNTGLPLGPQTHCCGSSHKQNCGLRIKQTRDRKYKCKQGTKMCVTCKLLNLVQTAEWTCM